MIPSAGARFGHELARAGILRDPRCRAREKLRHELARQLDVRLGDAREERRRGLVAGDVQRRLADDRAGVGGRVDDLEERHARAGESGEDRPRDRRTPAMPWEERRVHAEDALSRERDERVADELRPADDEDELGLELANRREGLLGVDVAGLVETAPRRRCDLVERALPRAIGVDRPGQRHDSDDLGAHVCSRLEAVAADRVEAHPDRAHRRAMV